MIYFFCCVKIICFGMLMDYTCLHPTLTLNTEKSSFYLSNFWLVSLKLAKQISFRFKLVIYINIEYLHTETRLHITASTGVNHSYCMPLPPPLLIKAIACHSGIYQRWYLFYKIGLLWLDFPLYWFFLSYFHDKGSQLWSQYLSSLLFE